MCVDIEFTRPQLSNDHINNKSFQITEPYKRCANTNFWPNVKKIQQQKTVGPEKKEMPDVHTQTHIYTIPSQENQVYDLRGMVTNPVWMAPINYSIGNSAITRILSFKYRARYTRYSSNLQVKPLFMLAMDLILCVLLRICQQMRTKTVEAIRLILYKYILIPSLCNFFICYQFFFTFLICLTQLVRNAISFCRQTKMTSPFSVKSLTRDKKCL